MSEILAIVQDIQKEVRELSAKDVGIIHDIDSVKEKISEARDDRKELWGEINKLKERMTVLEINAGKGGVKTDLVWKIIIAIATALAGASFLGGL